MIRLLIFLSGICLLALNTISTTAKEESQCISIRNISARCIELGQDGRWRYAIKFDVDSVHPNGNAIYVSSSTGHVGTYLFPWPSTAGTLVFRYIPITSNERACFTFTVYHVTDEGRRKLCRVEKCIELPKCEVKCEDVRKKLRNELTVFESEDALLKGAFSLLPSGVEWFSISIQNARHITVCSDSRNPVLQNLQTDITDAALSGAENPLITHHQVRWNFDSCFRLYDRGFKVLIDLPPFCPEPTSAVRCIDTAEICVKYAFKLCDGPRCDTTVCFRLIRHCQNSTGANSSLRNPSYSPASNLTEDVSSRSEFIRVFPNPTGEDATVEFLAQSDRHTINIDIIDVSGSVVLRSTAVVVNGSASLTFPTTSLSNGIYAVRVGDTPQVLTTTLVVNR